ncbi:hypothetical protein [Micromonospora chalcea]
MSYELGEVAVSYKLRPSEQVPEDIFRAWTFHFNELGLAAAYESDAAEEVSIYAETLRILRQGGASRNAILDQLSVQVEALTNVQGVNHWKSALYFEFASIAQTANCDLFLDAVASYC